MMSSNVTDTDMAAVSRKYLVDSLALAHVGTADDRGRRHRAMGLASGFAGASAPPRSPPLLAIDTTRLIGGRGPPSDGRRCDENSASIPGQKSACSEPRRAAMAA